MLMSFTCLKRLACRMGVLVALACTVPVAALAFPSAYLVPVGESRVYRLERPVKRVAVGNPEVADYLMLNSSELYLLGKKPGATNLVVWDRQGNFTSTPLQVSRNMSPIKALLKVVLPKENDVRIYALGPAVVLEGSVSDAMAAETVTRLVKAYLGGTVPGVNPESTLANSASAPAYATPTSLSGGSSGGSGSASSASMHGATTSTSSTSAGIPGLVNLLKVRDPQQVRLEVRIAEVSRSYIESLGLGWQQGLGTTRGSLMTGFVSNATLDLLLQATYDPITKTTVGNRLQVEAERKTSLFKILAEPTIVAMSGQEGYFLVGGKVYTPTVSTNGAVDYVERTYGVGLRFTPTVLDAGRISLRVAPEVSEPLKDAVFSGTTTGTLLPAFKTSYASTTVQMNEGENLVIGGLLRDNLNNVIRAVPLLGDIPILGALFRRTEMSSETTELMVIIRPVLVKASASAPELPTDRVASPTRKELFIDGKLQGSRVK
ncbi:MAG: type II and III secretion system protein family protein [Chlorobiaceae bacterium]|nr:type II and III secretion system protein family protein [Chlorobiaceae bacterium]